MAFSDMMSNLGSSAKGMFTDGASSKAVIFIPNPYKYMPDESGAVSPDVITDFNNIAQDFENELIRQDIDSPGFVESMRSVGGGIADAGSAVKNALSSKANFVAAAKSVGGALGDVLAGGGNDPSKVGKVAEENDNFFKITVQFNPASMRMDSVNGKVKSMNSSGNNTAKLLNEQEYSGRTKLSFDLIFDDVDLMDAFMLQEVVDMNASKIVGKVGDIWSHGQNVFSVRARMETFLTLLVSSITQHVIFHWGKMVFRGQVTGVTNTYNMFNTHGNPIRGTMHLEITQDDRKEGKSDPEKQGDNFSYQNKQWRNSFDRTFKEGMGGGKSTASKFLNNNILNF